MKTGEGEGGIPVTSPQVTLCNSKAGKRRSTFPVQENASRPGAAVDFPLHFLHLQRQLLLVLHGLSFLFQFLDVHRRAKGLRHMIEGDS